MAATDSNVPAGVASYLYRSVAPVSSTYSTLRGSPDQIDNAAVGSPLGESGSFDDVYTTTDFKLYSLKVRD